MKTSLKNQIQNKLDKLSQLLDQIDEARIIQPTEPETWDSDTLYNLIAQLKEALQLLQDQTGKEKDLWGDPIVIEEGLCSLVDQYHENEDYE